MDDIDLELTLDRLIKENEGITSPIFLQNEEFCDLLNQGVEYKSLNNPIRLKNHTDFYHELTYEGNKFLTVTSMMIGDL